MPDVAQVIARCDPDHNRPCEQPACAVCARDYRLWLTPQLLGLVSEYVGPYQVATIFLGTFGPGRLHQADVKRHHDRLRQRLNRAGCKGAIFVGGTEVVWQSGRWLLHVHLLAIGAHESVWQELRARWPRVGVRIPIKVDRLNDPERQVSYLQKFVTYHRPGARGLRGRGRAYPLPPDRLAELVDWWSGCSFSDFLFAYGARRRGRRIVVDE